MRSPGPSRWLILVLFAALGVAMTLWEPTRTSFVGPIWLAGPLLAALFFAVVARRALRVARLRRGGVPGTAPARHGARGARPRSRLRGPRDAPGRARPGGPGAGRRHPGDEEGAGPLSALESLRAGEQFPVRIDPGDPGRFAFEWSEGSGHRSSLIARALGGPETIDAAALEREAASIVQPTEPGP